MEQWISIGGRARTQQRNCSRTPRLIQQDMEVGERPRNRGPHTSTQGGRYIRGVEPEHRAPPQDVGGLVGCDPGQAALFREKVLWAFGSSRAYWMRGAPTAGPRTERRADRSYFVFLFRLCVSRFPCACVYVCVYVCPNRAREARLVAGNANAPTSLCAPLEKIVQGAELVPASALSLRAVCSSHVANHEKWWEVCTRCRPPFIGRWSARSLALCVRRPGAQFRRRIWHALVGSRGLDRVFPLVLRVPCPSARSQPQGSPRPSSNGPSNRTSSRGALGPPRRRP